MPRWAPAAVGSLIAAVLAIVVGVLLFELMTGGSGATASPSGPMPTTSPSLLATQGQSPPVTSAPTATTKPTQMPTPKPTPTPTPPLSIMHVTGGSMAGDHPVYEARAFVQDGYIKVWVVFQPPDGPCTLELVLFMDVASETYSIEKSEAKGTVSCDSHDYGLYSGPINITREGTLSGDFTLMASGSGEIITLQGEFDDLTIEGL